MEEIFKVIVEHPDYEISNLGNIKSRVKYKEGKILKCRLDNEGYYRTRMDGKNKRIHRLIAELFIPNPESKPYINHINGIKNDNRLENLEWCTQSENIYHSYKINLRPKGDYHCNSKLKEVDVIEILKSNLSNKELSLKFNTKISNITAIKRRERWKHIEIKNNE